jgi:hypothetical protein
VLSEITQKQLEDYSAKTKSDGDEFMSVYRGNMVRAAADVGFLVEPDWSAKDVDHANAGLVAWVSKCIADMIVEVMQIDPLPSSPPQTTPEAKD